jgi:hypothetical protein
LHKQTCLTLILSHLKFIYENNNLICSIWIFKNIKILVLYSNVQIYSFCLIKSCMLLTPKGLWVLYMEFRNFGHATMILIYNWIFWNFFGRKEIQRAFQQAFTPKILTLLQKLWSFFFFFLSNEGMLLATAIAPEFAQNCQILSKFA